MPDPLNVVRHTQRGRYGICFAPSLLVTQDEASLLGRWAEELVMKNYRQTQGSTAQTDWMDSFLQMPGGPVPSPITNPKLYFEFLVRHDPPLGKRGNEVFQEFQAGKMKIPDIVTNKGTLKVFYEIKPGSTTGHQKGCMKIDSIIAFMQKFNLDYKPGEHYNPGPSDDVDLTNNTNPILRIFGPVLGIKKITVTLTFRRPSRLLRNAGLVLYWICLDIEFDQDVEEHVVENIARWYVTHFVRMTRGHELPMSVAVNLADPAVKKLVPAKERILAAILTAPPATEYMLIGGTAAIDVIVAANSLLDARNQAMGQVQEGPYVIRRMQNNSWLNRHIDQIVLGIKIAAAVATVVVVVVVVAVATGGLGLAAAPEAAASGLAEVAVGDGAVVAGETAVTRAAGKAAADALIQFARQECVKAALRSTAAKEIAKVTAGAVAVLAVSQNAEAAQPKNPGPTQVQVVRLVPLRDVVNAQQAGALTEVTMRDGTKGFNLGRVRIENFDEIGIPLEAHRPGP